MKRRVCGLRPNYNRMYPKVISVKLSMTALIRNTFVITKTRRILITILFLASDLIRYDSWVDAMTCCNNTQLLLNDYYCIWI